MELVWYILFWVVRSENSQESCRNQPTATSMYRTLPTHNQPCSDGGLLWISGPTHVRALAPDAQLEQLQALGVVYNQGSSNPHLAAALGLRICGPSFSNITAVNRDVGGG